MTRLLALLFPLLLLAGCGQGDVLNMTDAEVRLSPVEGNPAAGYFTITGGKQDVQLLEVYTDAAQRLEMHETVEENGVASMRPISAVPIPAGKKVRFEPGGKHVMIWGISRGIQTLGEIELVAIFSNGDRIAATAIIVPAGGE